MKTRVKAHACHFGFYVHLIQAMDLNESVVYECIYWRGVFHMYLAMNLTAMMITLKIT